MSKKETEKSIKKPIEPKIREVQQCEKKDTIMKK